MMMMIMIRISNFTLLNISNKYSILWLHVCNSLNYASRKHQRKMLVTAKGHVVTRQNLGHWQLPSTATYFNLPDVAQYYYVITINYKSICINHFHFCINYLSHKMHLNLTVPHSHKQLVLNINFMSVLALKTPHAICLLFVLRCIIYIFCNYLIMMQFSEKMYLTWNVCVWFSPQL